MIKEKLETLDELILSGYKKVNEFCFKKFGTAKYTHSKICNIVGMASAIGLTAYELISGIIDPEFRTVMFLLSAGSISMIYDFYKDYKIDKLREELSSFLPPTSKTKTAPKPKVGRALKVVLGLPLLVLGGAYVFSLDVETVNSFKENIQLSAQSVFLGRAISVLSMGYLITHISSAYFRDCDDHPASKEKWYKRLGNYAKSKVKAYPALDPEAEPVKQYSLLEENVRQELPKQNYEFSLGKNFVYA